MIDRDNVVSLGAVVAALGADIDERKARRWCKNGTLPAALSLSGKRWEVDGVALEQKLRDDGRDTQADAIARALAWNRARRRGEPMPEPPAPRPTPAPEPSAEDADWLGRFVDEDGQDDCQHDPGGAPSLRRVLRGPRPQRERAPRVRPRKPTAPESLTLCLWLGAAEAQGHTWEAIARASGLPLGEVVALREGRRRGAAVRHAAVVGLQLLGVTGGAAG